MHVENCFPRKPKAAKNNFFLPQTTPSIDTPVPHKNSAQFNVLMYLLFSSQRGMQSFIKKFSSHYHTKAATTIPSNCRSNDREGE
jgi:hypothetical protein